MYGTEQWDDGNTKNGDGWGNAWTIESNYIWTGGSTTSVSVWTAWPAGYSPNTAKNAWVTVWGDGLRAGTEQWDDRNANSGDGCSSTCTIESGYVWSGGSTTTRDTWTLWTSGFYPDSTKATWVTQCGDSKRAGTEACDDGNTASSDGCSSTCTIEANYIWTGGTTTTKDTWSTCSSGLYPDSTKSSCVPLWGDSLRAGSEKWDDGNTRSSDGWTASWTIETNAICTGGSPTTIDVWTFWTGGFTPDATKTSWITVWGDGLRAGSEGCDDGNTTNGDGCSSSCAIEAGAIWNGGTTSTIDTWSFCSAGLYPNTGKTTCEAHWGDSKRAGSETWDDGNTTSGDGCSSSCAIEAGSIWNGGTTSSPDTCSICSAGLYPNTDSTVCEPHCGDSKRAGSETCDDGNTSNGDGCSSSCAIESNYVWSGGSTSSADTCSLCSAGRAYHHVRSNHYIWNGGSGMYCCTAGLSPDATKTSCVATWGDSKRAGSETWDDGNTTSGDGCSSSCAIEAGSIWNGGTTSSPDTCSICTAGLYPNTGSTVCEPHCGDSKRAGSETCDDGNTSNGDGCSSSCTIESNYVWSGDSTSSADTCSLCSAGLYPNAGSSVCEPHCGDSKRAGSETCDDGNTSNGDGCSSSCAIESNYIWNGGSTSSADTCTACTAGLSPDATKTSCVATWGDSKRAGSETCDDGNTTSGDGCSSSCAIEAGAIWNGGTTSSPDTCSICTAGLYPNTGSTVCEPHCGDSKRAGSETCDDGNTNNGDGCSSSCAIESNYIWNGGSTSSADACTACTAGLSPDVTKTSCVATWGDSKRAGSETCDDGNTTSGDGCSSSCAIEAGAIWNGGTTSSPDTCSICSAGLYPNTGSTICEPHCGDSKRAGSETCDDGNTNNGDGCSSSCVIESNYIWSGGSVSSLDSCSVCPAGQYPNAGSSVCETHCGDSKRAGSETCDDGNTSDGDGCSSLCAVESNYIWNGGSTSSADSCTACTAGLSPDVTKTSCVATWGDSKRAGSETCDDGNTTSGDGCSSSCAIEAGAIWNGGTTSSPDTCSICSAGLYPNTGSTICEPHCGDSKRAGSETCDDGNTNNGDGCSSSCVIESNYIWSGGSVSSLDSCSVCPAGQYPNADSSVCEPHCGDSKRAGSETCDDGNTNNGDGCSSSCAIESNYIWNGGSTSSADSCSACPAGLSPDVTKTSCVATWGDSKRAGSETCDDGNTTSGDGCSSSCAIEAGSIWNGGTTSSPDTCSICSAGLYPNTGSTICEPHWGDSKRAGSETCDDGNTINGDGCSSNWLTIESNSFCVGGSVSTIDICTVWTSGFYIDNILSPTSCITHCGDGLLAGVEQWDDGNTVNGDGWSHKCTVETNKKWVCHGGTGTSSDNCEVCGNGFNVNDNTNPRYCKSVCGDGLRVGSEVWDTGGISNSPWMKGWTTILAGFVCTGGDSSGADNWSAWPNSFSTNYDQSSWEVKPVTYAMEIYGYTYAALMIIGIICNIMSAYIFGYSFASIFSIITHVQMLLLTPLIEVSINENIISFYRMFKDVFFGFWFLTTDVVFIGYERVFGYDKYQQTSWYLNVVGYNSGSWIYTLGILFSICTVLLLFYLIIQLANLAFISQGSSNSFSRLIDKIAQFMTFKLFIRFIMLIFVCLLLGTLNGFAMNPKPNTHPASFTVAIIVYTLWVAFLAFSYVLAAITINSNVMSKMSRFKEFFNGVKLNILSRWYSSISLTRSFLFCNILCIFAGYNETAKLVTIIVIQACYLGYLWAARPFVMITDNIVEIFLEGCLLCYMIALSKFDADSSWSDSDIITYIIFLFVAVASYTIFAIGNDE